MQCWWRWKKIVKVPAHVSSIRKPLNMDGVHLRDKRVDITASLKKTITLLNVSSLQKITWIFCDNILWTDETKAQLFGRNTCCIWRKKAVYTTPEPLCDCEAGWGERRGLGLFLFSPQGLDSLQSLREQWVQNCIEKFYMRMSGQQSVTWGVDDAMTPGPKTHE